MPRVPRVSRSDAIALIACVAAPIVLWLACWPFANVGVNDDFSYAFTAKTLAETGEFRLNGWSNAMLGPQAYWGTLFTRAFGFSHDVLRVSMLPIAVACALLCYAAHRVERVPPSWAALATLTLVGSPLMVPWSASFMTDVPGLLFTLAIVLLALLAMRRPTGARAIGLLAAGVVGGSIRQTNFVLAGVALLAVLITHRAKREAAWANGACLALLALATLVLVRWNAGLDYAIAEAPFDADLLWPAAKGIAGLAATLLLAIAPFSLAIFFRRQSRMLGLLVLWTLACYATGRWLGASPFVAGFWSPNTLTPRGLLDAGIDTPGPRPIAFGAISLAFAAAVVYASVLGLILIARRAATPVDRNATWLLLALAAAYSILLVPRAGYSVAFDRYLLVLMPIVTLLIARRLATRGRPFSWAWALLAVWSLVGVAITRDHFAELRARDRVAATLMDRGVPREAIVNGLTFDAWTQLAAEGHLNDVRIVRPEGAYRPGLDEERRLAIYWLLPRTPAIDPRWIVREPLAPDEAADAAAAEGYRTLLPFGTRTLIAVRVGPSKS